MPSTKIQAALSLSLIALVLSPFLGGFFPALIAWRLSQQAEKDIEESAGFLLGAGKLPLIRRRVRIAMGITAISIAVVVSILALWLVRWLLGGGASFSDKTI